MKFVTTDLLLFLAHLQGQLQQLREEVKHVRYPLEFVDHQLSRLGAEIEKVQAAYVGMPVVEVSLVEVDEPEIDFGRPPWEGRG